MRHFSTLLNGSGKTLHEVLAVADTISPPMAGQRVDHGQRHGARTVKISHKILPSMLLAFGSLVEASTSRCILVTISGFATWCRDELSRSGSGRFKTDL